VGERKGLVAKQFSQTRERICQAFIAGRFAGLEGKVLEHENAAGSQFADGALSGFVAPMLERRNRAAEHVRQSPRQNVDVRRVGRLTRVGCDDYARARFGEERERR
jgi:hypothetical protein